MRSGRLQRGRASLTAKAVALARAAGSGPVPPDPTAPWLLGGWEGRLARALGRPAGRRLARWVSLGLLDHVALRTAAIDARLEGALHARPGAQLVVLGAGFDGRPWRMEALRGARVFEVDHPSTSTAKRRRAGRRPPLATRVRFVGVDLAREGLAEPLLGAGFDPAEPSVWLWEGVTPYLPVPAIEATLGQVARLAAPGSLLLLTYATPRLLPGPAALDPLVLAGFALLGEPLRGLLTPAQLGERLRVAGFRLEEDSGEEDWGRPLRHRSRPLPIARAERLAVARRMGGDPRETQRHEPFTARRDPR